DLLMQLARKRGLELTKPAARAVSFVANDWRENLGDDAQLESLVGERIRDAEVSLIRDYVRTLRSRNQCDFSGLLTETVHLLRENPDIRGRMQARFRFIQVDEFQDTNL